ncbi:MAG: BatD family protein [Kiritimatiellia bacterium]
MPVSAEVSLDLKCSRAKIFLGESFNITLSVNGADKDIQKPDFSTSDPAEITFLGSHSNSRSSIQIVNGKFSRQVFRGRVLSYALKPEKAGVFRTGSIKINVNNKTVSHPGTSVLVKKIEKQNNVIVSVDASSKSVLVEEPFDIKLSIAVRELPDPYCQHNEPVHPGHLPHITAGFLEIKDEKDTLIRPDLNEILSDLIDQSGRQPAFRINDYKSRGMSFGSFFNSDPFQSRPLRFRLKQEKKKINNIPYRVYSLTLPYTATGEGEHVFGPVTFKGKIISNVKENRQAELKDIYTVGPAVTVRVIPPPDEGRPEEFIGSVGKNITVHARLDTSVCKVGDPLTLTLEIAGDISISNMRTPILNLQENLTKDFRIYDENVKTETLENGKRFIYRVRPTKSGTLEFPPVKISYYDTDENRYKTITTSPLPIQAESTTQVSAGSDNYADSDVIEIKKALPLPCGITLTDYGLSRASLLPAKWTLMILVFLPPLLFITTLLYPGLIRVRRKITTHSKRTGALSRAVKRIRRASTAEEISKAIRAWFTDRLNAPGHSLTSRESEELLRTQGVSEKIRSGISSLITELDEAMYHPEAEIELPKRRCADLLRKAENDLTAKSTDRKDI